MRGSITVENLNEKLMSRYFQGKKRPFDAAKTKNAPDDSRSAFLKIKQVARVTGLEPATLGVTGRYSNQLSYTRALKRCSASWEPRN